MVGPSARPLDASASVFKDDDSVATGPVIIARVPYHMQISKPQIRTGTSMNLDIHSQYKNKKKGKRVIVDDDSNH